MHAHRTALLSLFLALPALASCAGDDGTSRPAWTERDSAGVTVVENHLQAVPSGGWRVDPEPFLAIGGLDAPEGQLIYQVTGATRLPDGRVVTSSDGSYDVRVYGPEGALQARYGGEGDGPDEFRDPTLVGRYAGDTVVILDGTLSRVTWVHPDQGIVGSAPAAWPGKGYPWGRGLLDDGSIVVGGAMVFSSQEGFPTGVIRPISSYGWLTRNGDGATQLGDLPAAEMFAQASETGFMAQGLPFSRRTVVAPAGNGVWLGTGDTWSLSLYGPDGGVRRVVRGVEPPRAVTAAQRSAYIEEAVADASTDNEARQTRALLDEMPFPQAFPPYQLALTDALGNVWVQAYQAPEDSVGLWTVLDAQGRAVSRLTTPPRTRVLEVGADYLLGRTTDDLGVETLTLWRLHRG